MSAREPRPAARAGVCDLSTAELLTLWSVRQRLADGAESGLLVEGFRRAFGLAAVEDALSSFERAFAVLSSHLTRDLGLMRPGCRCLSGDEALLLHLCAAVQDGRLAHAREVAQALVGPVWAALLCDRLGRFVAVMGERGLRLPLRAFATPVPANPTYH